MADWGEIATTEPEQETTWGEIEIGEGQELRPGESWTLPIEDEHPELSFTDRLKIKSFADTGPRTMARNLQNMGFETRHRDGLSFSIKKPGEKRWYVVDPAAFEPLDDPLEFLASIAPSVIGQAFAPGKGLLRLLASGAGAAGGEGLKMGAGKLMGLEYDPQEVVSRLEAEIAFGAGSEALAPHLAKLAKGGKKFLVGDVGETAAKNLEKVRAYKKLLAETPEGAPLPARPALEEATKEGLLPAAARKFREARTAKTLLEAPERLEREAFEGGAEELTEQVYREYEELADASLGELKRQGVKIGKEIMEASEKGLDTTHLENQLARIREAEAVEQAFKEAEKRSGAAGRAVTGAGKKVTNAQKRIDKWTKEISDLEAEIGKKEAQINRSLGAKVQMLEEQLDDLVIDRSRFDTWTKEYKRLNSAISRAEKRLEKLRAGKEIEEQGIKELGKDIPRLKSRLKAAKKSKRGARQALKKAQREAFEAEAAIPGVEPIAKQAFIRNLAEDAGIDVTGKSGQQVVKALDDLITDKKYAEYLKTGQDPAVREALDRQVRGIVSSFGPEEQFGVTFARRGEKAVGEVPVEERYFRNLEATRDIPFDPAAYQQAARDLEGKTLDEMRQVLDESGWVGPVPSDLEGITEVLYRARQGITGEGMKYDPVSKQLVGAESPFAGAVADVEQRAAGEQPWRVFGGPETTEIRTPTGETIRPGRELAEEQVQRMGPIQRRIAQPSGIERQAARGLERLRKGASEVLERGARVVGAPGRWYDVLAPKAVDALVPKGVGPLWRVGVPAAALLYSGPVQAAAATVLTSKLLSGGMRKLASGIMAEPQALMSLLRKASGPVADKMRIPIQAFQRGGLQSYKASVYSMLHQPDVRLYLQGLLEKEGENE